MTTTDQHTRATKPPRPLQVKLPEEVDLLLRRTAIEQRRNLTDLVIEAIIKTFGPGIIE